MDDVSFAEQMGNAAAARVAEMTWAAAIDRLVIV
jgi:hypothetical protein